MSGGSSDLKLITDLSSSSTVVFTVDAKEAEIDSSGKVTFIWASCATKPDSTDTDAEIEMHDSGKYGSTSISLASSGGGNGNGNGGKDDDDDSGNSSGSPSTSSSTPTGSRSQDSDQSGGTKTTDSSNVSSSSSSSAGSDETTGGSSSSDNSSDDTQAVTSGGPDVDPKVVFIIHAIFAIIAWVVFTPLAIVFGRFRPYKSAATQPIKPILYWMHMVRQRRVYPITIVNIMMHQHERLQYSTLALTCIVVALGVYGINAKGVPHFSETHQVSFHLAQAY